LLFWKVSLDFSKESSLILLFLLCFFLFNYNKMGETAYKIKEIIEDFKNSWYFRIWTFFWLICALVSFSALIILGSLSNLDNQQQDIRIWRENVSSLNFPQFHFRVGGQENVNFLNYNCWHLGMPVQIIACTNSRGDDCFALSSSNISAPNNINAPFESARIDCTIITTNTSGNSLLAFEIEGNNIASYGGNSYASLWFAPNNFAWIMLEQAIYTPSSGPVLTEWDRTLLYHSSVAVPGFYNVSVILGSFYVEHWDQVASYNGWMSTGDVGGFTFFCVIIHSIVMILFGIVLDNNSKFLTPSE